MTAHDSALPDDVDTLKAMVRAMAEKTALLEQRNAHLEQVNKGAEERIARLMAIVKMLERARYGTPKPTAPTMPTFRPKLRSCPRKSLSIS